MNTPTAALVSPAWILAGRMRHVPGLLVADRGRLEFRTSVGPAFAAPFALVGSVTWPWWWFGGGFVAVVGGERFKVTFIRPNGAPAAPEVSLADTALFAGGISGPGGCWRPATTSRWSPPTGCREPRPTWPPRCGSRRWTVRPTPSLDGARPPSGGAAPTTYRDGRPIQRV